MEEEDAGHRRRAAAVVQVNGTPVWHTLEIDAPGAARSPTAVDGVPLVRGERGRARCSPTATRCADCGGRARRRRARRRRAALPGLRRSVLPRRRRAARWTTTTCSSSRCRCCASRRRSRSRCEQRDLDEAVADRRRALMVSGLRGLAKPKPPQPRQRGRREERCDLCADDRAGRPPAHAQPLRAPDRLRVRELLGAALRRRRVPRRPGTARCGSRTSSCRRSCGRSSGSRSGWRSSCTRASPTASSRCTRARPARPRASCTSRPGSGSAGSTRCSRDLEPDAEALIVNRMAEPPAFAIAPIDRCYMLVGLVKAALGGHLGRRRRGARRSRATSTSCGRWPREPAESWRRRSPEPEFQVLGATGRRHAAVPALDFDVHVTRARRARGLRDRAHARR